jgi:predicted porin
MKKSLIAIAVLGAFAGAASAQSSVTLFGIADVNVQQIKGDGNGSVTRLHNSGYNSARWGIRGEEDLGGGLKAGFWLEGAFGPDDGSLGTASTNNQSAASTVLFGRRATVSLMGGFGEVRLGRDLTPDYNGIASADPFGSNGSAQSLAYTCQGLSQAALPGAACVTNVRASNSITYFLPSNLGGLYGSAMYAFGENASNAGSTKNDGKHIGARLGFAGAGLDASVFYGKTEYFTAGDWKRTGIAGSYTFGAFKPMAFWAKTEIGTQERKDWGLGLAATFGPHLVRAQYNNYDVDATNNDGKLFGIGYAYNMSRRTILYANYGRVDNDGTGTSFNVGRSPTTLGGASTGMEFGIRHSF